ncbi:hypothetical protein GQ55_1G062000 [Panicum hallii var. hallii]|uniref:Uncharacterized protein n=1 Tax=Panicum hallii var. hallii TaxID=1504633 RepID=A0A2T7F2T7_9POAL|nr:hypothetical protein GQ55_1G062000 [Panicum hallii var. hallii]
MSHFLCAACSRCWDAILQKGGSDSAISLEGAATSVCTRACCYRLWRMDYCQLPLL